MTSIVFCPRTAHGLVSRSDAASEGDASGEAVDRIERDRRRMDALRDPPGTGLDDSLIDTRFDAAPAFSDTILRSSRAVRSSTVLSSGAGRKDEDGVGKRGELVSRVLSSMSNGSMPSARVDGDGGRGDESAVALDSRGRASTGVHGRSWWGVGGSVESGEAIWVSTDSH